MKNGFAFCLSFSFPLLLLKNYRSKNKEVIVVVDSGSFFNEEIAMELAYVRIILICNGKGCFCIK
jgi:hypothetical protein